MTVAVRYFIKTSYQKNLVQHSYDIEGESIYWNDVRIRNSHVFQYYVFELARDLICEKGFRNMMDVGSGPGAQLKELIAPVGV